MPGFICVVNSWHWIRSTRKNVTTCLHVWNDSLPLSIQPAITKYYKLGSLEIMGITHNLEAERFNIKCLQIHCGPVSCYHFYCLHLHWVSKIQHSATFFFLMETLMSIMRALPSISNWLLKAPHPVEPASSFEFNNRTGKDAWTFLAQHSLCAS